MRLEDDFESISAETIERYVNEGQEEQLHLDFKLVSKPDMNRDDRKNLAIALSGFANADGGLIVWGVDARKDPTRDHADCASEAQAIPSLSLFLSKLNEHTGQAANPIPDGVRHKSIETGEDIGFAVTLVPASDAGPHMAKLGEDRYYKRSGDSFLKMEHYEIADMFGRRRRPVLELYHRLAAPVSRNPRKLKNYLVGVFLGLRNLGRGSARDLFLSLTLPEQCKLYAGGPGYQQGLRRLPRFGDSNIERFGGWGDIVLHPGLEHDVTIITVDVPAEGPIPDAVKLPYTVAAEDHPLTEKELIIGSKELLEKVQEAKAKELRDRERSRGRR